MEQPDFLSAVLVPSSGSGAGDDQNDHRNPHRSRTGFLLFLFWNYEHLRSARGFVSVPGFVKIADDLLFIEAEEASVSAYKSLVEDTAGQLLEVLFLDGFQRADPDFGRLRDLLKRNAAHLALSPKPLAKTAHCCLSLHYLFVLLEVSSRNCAASGPQVAR